MMTRRTAALAALAWLATYGIGAAGQIVALDLSGIQDGSYVLRIDGSTVSVTPLTLIDPGVPVPPRPPVPPDPQPPDPPDLPQRAREIADAARIVQGDPARATTAAMLAAAYREIASQITAGRLSGTQTITLAARLAADTVLERQKAAAAWQPVRDLQSDHVAALAQEGGSEGDYARLLGEWAAGLEASGPDADADADTDVGLDLRTIVELVRLILELIDRLQPEGAA